jgi:carboxypeptidase family protein
MHNAARITRLGSSWRGAFTFILLTAMACFGQEYRATLTGSVTDSSKAIISGATVSVRNLDTNEVITVKTNSAGVYTIPFLHPGHRLEVSADAPGFRKEVFPPIELSVSQTQTADFVLKVGTLNETVTVTSEAYEIGLDSAKADRSQLVDNKTLTELPLNGRNSLSLLDTLAGITDENGAGSPYSGSIAANNMYYAGQFTINGGRAMNIEFTIDGEPNNAVAWFGANGPSLIPSIDALQEMKVVTNPYDAQQGRSAGGVINMELKSGTNQLHGTAYEFAKRGYLDANSYANNDQTPILPRPTHTEDQYGFEIGGPVYIPHIYDGHGKTFFMFSLERLKEDLPTNWRFDMPSAQWLNGDFSNLGDLSSNCLGGATSCLIPVYDPASRATGVGTAQQIFDFGGQLNHVDPSRFNPVAVNVIKLILANATPTSTRFPGEAPWETMWEVNSPQTQWAHNYIAKVDQIIGAKDHLSINYIHDENLKNYITAPVGPLQNGENFMEYHLNAGVDWVHTFRSNLLLDAHVSYQRYWRSDGYPGLKYNPGQLGFDPNLLAALSTKNGFPQIGFNDPLFGPASSPQSNVSVNPGYGSWIDPSRDNYYLPDDTISVAPTLTWIRNKHTLRMGVDIRNQHQVQAYNGTNVLSINSNGQATNEYYNKPNFNDRATAPDGTPLSTQSGNPVLDFLLGQPSTAQATNQVFPFYTWRYVAPWFQDDWKVIPKLTLNLGLRYDLNGPPTARNNWLNTGFNFTAVNPINSEINRSTYPNVPTLLGGITFPTATNNLPWNPDYSKIQPRVGFAYQINDKTVLRGGFGRIIMSPEESLASLGLQQGFSNPPTFVGSPDGGFTFYNAGGTGKGAGTLYNPFALSGGVPSIPFASAGLLTNVGNGAFFANPGYQLPYVNSSSLGIQRALPKKGKLEVSYVASRSYDQDVSNNTLNTNLPLYKSCNEARGTIANPQPSAACTNAVNNPFQGLPGVLGGLSAPQISALQLASSYPEFTSLNEGNINSGKSWYNSLQTTYGQRISWAQVSASYTWSKTMENYIPNNNSQTWLDPYYQIPVHTIAPTDRKNRITLQSVLDIPVGRGRTFFSGMNRPVDAVIGGWQLGTDFFWESGQPLLTLGQPGNGGYNLVGSIRRPKQSAPGVLDLGYNGCYQNWIPSTSTTPGSYGPAQGLCTAGVAWQQEAPFSPITTQPWEAAIRAPGTQQIDADLNKSFKFTERVSLQLRMEMFNVLNHPTWFSGTSTSLTSGFFGEVNKANGQSNQWRQGQLAGKIIW